MYHVKRYSRVEYEGPTSAHKRPPGLKMCKSEIQVIRQPDEDFLRKKGVFDWPTWGCETSRFPWTYYESESCYLLEGNVVVTPSDGRTAVSFQKGDYVTFPSGLACVWDVKEAVLKHYMFH